MCGRFTLAVPTFTELADILGVMGATADPALASIYQPRYNIAPMTTHVVLRMHGGHRELIPARWGLINHWAKDASGAARAINARSETARERASFREAFERRRCVVPADGFYEWAGPKGDRRPIWYHPPKGGLLHLAGLYEMWRNPSTGEPVRTFTILTTQANDVIAPVHDRMPVILAPEDVDAWIATPAEGAPSNAEQAASLMRPAPSEALAQRFVSRRVNGVAYDGPDLLHEDEPEAPGAEAAAPPKAGGRKKKAAQPDEDMPLFDRVKRA